MVAVPSYAHTNKQCTRVPIFHILTYTFLFTVFFLVFSRAAPVAYRGSQARGLIGAVATGLYHSHSNAGSELYLRPTPQLRATLDP